MGHNGTMHIDVKCFATLASYAPTAPLELPEGATPALVMERLGLPPAEVRIIFINGAHAQVEAPLKDGDRLGLFPAVGGG